MFDSVSPYVLLYPDFSEVYFVPGTKDIFSLSKYKEAIGKDYKRLTFYLCTRDEFQDNQISDSSSHEDNDEHKVKEENSESKLKTLDVAEKNPPIYVMEEDDDPVLLLAINQSEQEAERKQNEENVQVPAEPCTLAEALEMKLNSVPNEEYTVIEVTRKHLVERTFEQLQDEVIKGRVVVKFIGEDAADTGVTREFFTDYFKGMQSSSDMIRGSYPNLTFRHNLHALEEGKFEMFGRLVAVALLNGCPGPNFFLSFACCFFP